MASQTNRLVLVHFWAEWCKPCAEMERDVFSRQDVVAAIEAGFVPVKVNVDHFPAKVRQYGVSIVPTDVVLTPDGQLVDKLIGSVDASQYVARLSQITQSRGAQARTGYGHQTPAYQSPSPYSNNRYPDSYGVGQPTPGTDTRPGYQQPTPAYQGAATTPYATNSATPYESSTTTRYGSTPAAPEESGPPSYEPDTAGNRSWQTSADASRAEQASPAMERPLTDQLPPGSPPLALDGFCPVRLNEQELWVQGDLRWGARHEGQTYLFSGPEEQQRFLDAPKQYAPVYSGYDVVLAVQQGIEVPGRREHGVWYRGKVYLFSNEASVEQFNSSPEQYIFSLEQMASGTARRPISPAPAAGAARQTLAPSYGRRY